jgi:glycosyltransferase involved in cell wall biosynthesis
MSDARSITLEPHNISVVTETYPPEVNGVSLTLGNLVKGLRARGHSVSLVRPGQKGFDANPTRRDATLVRGLPLPGYHGLQFGVPSIRLLQRNWRVARPDVVYVATEGPLGWSAIRAARYLQIPVISGFHTNYHSYCRHYRLGWLQHLALQYLRWFHNHTNFTLVSNEDLRRRLLRLGFNNVGILERGVDSGLFTPQRRCDELRHQWGASESTLVLIYVGRVATEKNLGLAIQAYRAAHRCFDGIKFVIVGDGPVRQTLERAHRDLIFTGSKTGEDLARHYASADIFLFASETETFGNVTLEAMASGLAVIAYDYAGARLHIENRENGVLVPYGDARAFIASTCALAGDRSALLRIRQMARDHAAQVAWTRVVEQFESLLVAVAPKNREPAVPFALGQPMEILNTGECGDVGALGID